MNIREQIIETLSQKPAISEDISEYTKLKQCLNIKFFYDGWKNLNCAEIDQFDDCMIDFWFSGIIGSLYYKPNKYVLVLEGEQCIGKTEFFRRLSPNYSWYSDCDDKTNVFEFIILDTEFTKRMLNLPICEDFTIRYPYTTAPVTDKRLASYCTTTNDWVYPKRKNFIVLHVNSIYQELFNSINKLELWKEIFNTFKPLHDGRNKIYRSK